MVQFNLNRFGKLARWSLTNDKKYHIKSFFQNLVIFTLVFVFFTSVDVKWNQQNANYFPCSLAAIVAIGVTLILGSSFMFYSMDRKHDMQTLLMLPASNLEKYLVRYASWIILLPIQLVAFFAADVVQYVYGLVVGHEELRFVTSAVMDMLGNMWHQIPAEKHYVVVIGLALLAVWLHSVYALGATFFRSRKFNGVLSMLVIILIGMLILWLTPDQSALQYDEKSSTQEFVMGNVIYIGWILLNFWLSYRLFCRTQVIGKFVNL